MVRIRLAPRSLGTGVSVKFHRGKLKRRESAADDGRTQKCRDSRSENAKKSIGSREKQLEKYKYNAGWVILNHALCS